MKPTKKKPKYCVWEYRVENFYQTSCENAWEFTVGDLKENKVKFCPYCLDRIKENKVALEGFDPVEERCPGHEKERMVGK